jgi:peroxiredoxin Q/BCP
MATLQEGDKAPDFTAKDQNGKTVSLADYKGKNVILYFYPKDDGVSTDDEKSHKKFETKYNLPFTLIADNDHQIVEAYGVWAEKNNYGKKYMGTVRTTFIIDANGVISHIISKVDTQNSSQQVLELVK